MTRFGDVFTIGDVFIVLSGRGNVTVTVRWAHQPFVMVVQGRRCSPGLPKGKATSGRLFQCSLVGYEREAR